MLIGKRFWGPWPSWHNRNSLAALVAFETNHNQNERFIFIKNYQIAGTCVR
jgi:hypothetical protein